MSDTSECGRGSALENGPVAWGAPRRRGPGLLLHSGGINALLPPGEDARFHGRCKPKLPPCGRQRSSWDHATRRAVHLESRRGARGSRGRGGGNQWPVESGVGFLVEERGFLQGLAVPAIS